MAKSVSEFSDGLFLKVFAVWIFLLILAWLCQRFKDDREHEEEEKKRASKDRLYRRYFEQDTAGNPQEDSAVPSRRQKAD
mmetsp:Transcript_87899/g.137705  ORF Transcript_87899/g.137705 Transcript_87899/m.137705 type:complete len:80 (-) Transcript_87899:64-303(-)